MKIVYGFDLLLPRVQRHQQYSEDLRFMDPLNVIVFCMTYHHLITQHVHAEVKSVYSSSISSGQYHLTCAVT